VSSPDNAWSMLHTSPLAAIRPMATKTSVTPNMLAYSALAVMVIFDLRHA